MSELNERYNPQEVEDRIYSWWEKNGFFKASDKSSKPPFSIILPPPNVTGFLHLGHALDHSIQDCLIRWKRMSGFNALWLPGTDHAGIATQAVVERELKKEGQTRHDLGREAFEKKVWQWKELYGDRIVSQMKKLGDSCDWDRLVFTLDPKASRAVRRVFVQLYKKKMIYRGLRLVNWSGPLETAISDIEVDYQQIKGTLWHIKYPIERTSDFLIVATTRPETLLGDTAVCVHPEDERYQKWIGKNVRLPLANRSIPIIADPSVDRQFGSGVVKITPAHDFNDYKVGQAHGLPMINLLTKKAEMNENAGAYQGLKVQEARKRVVQDLKDQNFLEKEEPHVHNVGHCSRTGAVAEPFLSEQWFVKMEALATPAKRVVESGTVKIEPESWTKVYLHWLNNIQDWCISRQLWWGHRIPAWTCADCGHITVSFTDPTECESCQSSKIAQDPDVLDTWFSSALWPFSTLNWPEDSEALKTFYPTSVLVTGHDILFFWVARMIMMGLEFVRDVPFRLVHLHGIVRDAQGRKMSKSLGNSVDPVELIGKYGADSLRFSLLAHVHSGKDLKFSEQRTEGYRNFMNKLWNATRFSLTSLKDFQSPATGENALPSKIYLSIFDQWLLEKLKSVEQKVEEALEQNRFSDAAGELYAFTWYELCDWYIEFIKPLMAGPLTEEKKASQLVLAQVLNRVLRLLHPFAPFVTEELFQKLPIRSESCIQASYPTVHKDKALLALGSSEASFEVEVLKSVVTAVRNIRGENRMSPALKIKARVAPLDDRTQKILLTQRSTIEALARLESLEISTEGSLSKCAVTVVTVDKIQLQVVVPLEGLVDFAEEIKRIQKALEKLTKESGALAGRLSNENFVKNASEEVVEADRQLLSQHRVQIENLQQALVRFQT